ncbi:MAG: MTH1187 family thiamine-binding protein [Halanaeroarchaeum sp.]
MTVTAMLSVSPVDDPSVDFEGEIAKAVEALEDFDVRYETHPMETTIEAADLGEVFDAARAATEALDADRTLTSLKIDHFREQDLAVEDKVTMVEDHLGRPARSER